MKPSREQSQLVSTGISEQPHTPIGSFPTSIKLRASPHGKVAVASLATGWHWRASVELGRTQVSSSCAALFPWEAEQMPKGSYSGWAVVTICPTPTSSGGLTGQLGAGTGPGRSLSEQLEVAFYLLSYSHYACLPQKGASGI